MSDYELGLDIGSWSTHATSYVYFLDATKGIFVWPSPNQAICLTHRWMISGGKRAVRSKWRKLDAWRTEGIKPTALRVIRP